MTSHNFTEIPRLDLSLADDPATEAGFLSQLRHAIIDIGFLYVENHGVPSDVVSAMQNALPDLFSLSAEGKAEVALEKSPHFLGYSGDGSEMTAGKVDCREQFEFATQLTASWKNGDPLCEKLRGPNQWPSRYPGIRPIVESYIEELTRLGERFIHLVGKALDLPSDSFLPFLSDQHRLKLVHYPAMPEADARTQGVGPHKDSSGWWTFLLQASPPHVKGLQVLNKSGDWIDVPVISGSLVVNIGQAFEVVTSGMCKATTHRVLGGQLERFSVPFFQGVRSDLTRAEALDTFKEHFRSPAFDPTSSEKNSKEPDVAFLKGEYSTWGESQLHIKIGSHPDVAKVFYSDTLD